MRVAVDGVYFGILPQLGPDEMIALAREVGAEGLNWPFTPAYGAEDPEPMARKLREAGLAVVSLGMAPHTSAVPGEEEAWREAVRRAVAAAGVFGTTVIDCWPRRMPDVEKAEAQRVLAANLAAVAPAAQSAGCVLSFEFEPDHTVERFAEAMQFTAPFGPAVRLTADSYHIIRIGDDLAEAGAALGTRSGVLHFSGSHRGEPGSEGDRCDYAAFLRAAVLAGYRGDIVLQYAAKGSAADSLRRSVALTRRVMAQCAI